MGRYKAKVNRGWYQKAKDDSLGPRGRKVFNKCNNNPKYAFMQDTITLLGEKLTTYETNLADLTGTGTANTETKNKSKKEVIDLLDLVANALDFYANGDLLTILLSGMHAQKIAERHTGELAMPTKCSASATTVKGQAALSYRLESLEGIKQVAAEWSQDKETWHNGAYGAAYTKDGRIVVSGLPSLTKVYF